MMMMHLLVRFESLTLSHNNMIALKPILHAWLEEAEAQARNKRRDPEAPSVLPLSEKKRKRTSIAAPEKRSLEAYFVVQVRTPVSIGNMARFEVVFWLGPLIGLE